ncbi:MAG: geranylgeranylglycerol-phosphate geranylgeranyltransferase [Methanosarcina flavescens]|jgi:geranylgeranylglycerol-phosphate geranylgeranyltransferase|uniref:Digeranylgeranylglyceryl phosphate synthase n=1 Tax=Methanosarcina flavescens TaxID=1715806 RepID=A0A660HR90_9EURY|nr:geranylgeranylglycerol-phosphate geranylgeranyltransferase [Methanosarcina flavescens]AYK14767.1 geranylgeranylglycerol-phosphate geranylgeranyltransferase [Methanosarcina flavescens]NLK33102.1 geranylgeranylglycerol-phosphate geranylgeranyltransferase [Methanosarcina flavescens]
MSAGIRTYLELMRYENCLMAGFAAVIGTLIAFNILISDASGSYSPENFPLFYSGLVFLVVLLISGAGNTINDYFDVRIDSINRPDRPIPSGRATLKEALYFSYTLFSLGTLLAFWINLICGFIALFNSLLLIFYAKTLKGTPLLGNLSIGYLTGSTFLFGASVFGFEGLEVLFVLFLLAALAITAREIVKDIEDIEGDKVEGADTLPIRVGAKKAGYLAVFIGLLAVLLSPLPYFMQMLGVRYLYLVLLADMGFFAAIYQLLVRNNPTKSSRMFKIAMFFALIAFIAGV